ncbi:MAG TPA: glycosyltransferase family 4 protein [Candidatus Binataceae bacterium]
MKVLHIFPQLTPDLVSGSESYEYMLSRKLAELGVEVDILTTRTKNAYPTAAFTSAWPNQHPAGEVCLDGIRIRRFSATFDIGPRLGHWLSRRILKRWEREEGRFGTMLRGSRNLPDYYQLRARSRPRIYDLMMLAGRGPWSLPLLAHLALNLRRYDAVMVGFTPFALMPPVAAMARLFGRPVVILPLFHPQDIYHHFAVFYRCFARADTVLAQTSYSAGLLARMAPGCSPVDLGAGVNLEEMSQPQASGARFRVKYGLEGRKIILFVGRKEFFKRYDLAVAAIELIGDARVRLVMIGRDIDGQPVSSPYVSFLGEVERQDLLDAYDACDVFLLPSENESFGMVFLEAWARRKPVIGNRSCGPVACLIDESENGYLCSTAEEIAGRIARLIADPELAARLGQAGHDKVLRRYTWDAIAGTVRDLYARLSAAKAHPSIALREEPKAGRAATPAPLAESDPAVAADATKV